MMYDTGRVYDGQQILAITVEHESVDEWGLRVIEAIFLDASRHISGRVNTILFGDDIGQAILSAYDAGQYKPL